MNSKIAAVLEVLSAFAVMQMMGAALRSTGAVATDRSVQAAESLGLNAADHLSRNDAHVFFDKLGDLIKTGPSGTNVNDIVFCFAL